MEEGVKVLSQNRKAFHEYSVDERFECGIVLEGTEVKSLKGALFSYPDSYAEIREGEVWLKGLHINPYAFSSVFNHDPDRPKKLLLHAREIRKLERKVTEKGFTLIPLSFYLKRGRVKVELGLCKGKKLYDKRADIKEKDVRREVARDFRGRLE
jgi:SsrA-binding protein